LKYDSTAKKWFVYLSYKPPAVKACEHDPKNEVAVMATDDPAKAVIVQCGDEPPRWVAGTKWTNIVAHKRRQLLQGRWRRQRRYNYAVGSRKGHGRKRALQSSERFNGAWQKFTLHVNREIAKDVL